MRNDTPIIWRFGRIIQGLGTRLPGELPIPHHIILVSGADGENRGNKGGNDEWDGREVEHDPAHRNHLGHGADFTGPERLDGDFSIQVIENPDSDNDFEIPGDDENDEPNGKVPSDSPVHEGRGEEPGHQKGLVGKGVEDGSGEGFLIKAPGDPAIETIEKRGEGVDGDCKPAEGFLRCAGVDRASVVDCGPGKNRDETKANEGNKSGKSHDDISFYWTFVLTAIERRA